MKINTILILAGGDGDRFFPLEQKGRFSFNGKTVLQHIVESVKEYAEHIVIVTNETNAPGIKLDLSSHAVTYVTQHTDKGGMADAVIAAKEFLVKDTLILNGNDLVDFSLIPQLVNQTKTDDSPVGFLAKYMPEYFPGGYVVFEDDKAVGIMEKPSPERCPSDYVELVVNYFPESSIFLHALQNLSASDDQYERGLSVLMTQKPATCVKYEGDWVTLKYSWHVLSMQDYFLTHRIKKSTDVSATIDKTATIEGEVFIGKNVKIGAYCKIAGPCYIADDVVVGDHSLIRNSTIGKNSVVGSGCEIARSYLGEGVMLHRNYVGDSVLSSGVSMGAGAVTANYRFDAQAIRTPIGPSMINSQRKKFGLIAGVSTKIGVNVSTYPGVKISPNSFILPGEVVKKDR